MSARRVWGIAAVAALLVSAGGSVAATKQDRPAFGASVTRAYAFLGTMMDRYATGPVPRLVQSFAGGVLGARHFTDSETYDDAVMIDALLAEGTRDGRSRAVTIGNGLLYVQAHDPAADGRIRAAYVPRPLNAPADVRITDKASDVGTMAWTGMVLVRLYRATCPTSGTPRRTARTTTAAASSRPRSTGSATATAATTTPRCTPARRPGTSSPRSPSIHLPSGK